jgi:transposase
MNSEKYCNILKENLLIKQELSTWLFQQDGAPCHRAVATRNFLEDNGIELLPWPPKSPDLSIIENVWAYIKDTVN